jgi:hypothetical protein
VTVEVFDNGGDLDSVFGYSLREDRLMSQVSNKGGTLLIEDEAGWLTASRKRYLHLALVDLIDVTVGRYCEEITL